MKLSVCIFTYNHADFIAQTIDSVLTQVTDFDFEIVIGEDCSTDGTADIVKAYQKNHPGKIKAHFNGKNLGLMKNNMQTIMRCEGEYIALLDGDDYWIFDKKLQTQVDFLDNHLEYIFNFHDGLILSQDGVFGNSTCCSNIIKPVVTFDDIICEVSIPTFSIVFRRQALTDYPPKWFQRLNAPDRPLFLLLAALGPAYYFNNCWAVYRKHSTGTWTSQHYQSQLLTHLQIYKVINKHFNMKFNRSFCKCESRISYILALRLLEDNKLKRANCFFRKYRRVNKGQGTGLSWINLRAVRFHYLYLKKTFLGPN